MSRKAKPWKERPKNAGLVRRDGGCFCNLGGISSLSLQGFSCKPLLRDSGFRESGMLRDLCETLSQGGEQTSGDLTRVRQTEKHHGEACAGSQATRSKITSFLSWGNSDFRACLCVSRLATLFCCGASPLQYQKPVSFRPLQDPSASAAVAQEQRARGSGVPLQL